MQLAAREPDPVERLNGLTALITGASRGLGRAMALSLGTAGAHVVLTGRDEQLIAEAVRTLERRGCNASGYRMDIRDDEAVMRSIERIWDDSEGIDILFANAGVSLVRPATQTTSSQFESVLRTNVVGTFTTVREVGSRMLERGSGKIVTVSSDVGIRGVEGWVAYGASKAAIISMTKTLAWEWAPTLTVNSIAPGAFATDINRELLADPSILAALEGATPLGRVGRAEEIGPLAVFLASSGSDFMTGQVISLDGGIQRS